VIQIWRLQNYNEPDEFCRKREEFYGVIGLDKRRVLSKVLPEISRAEIELFRKILQTPDLPDRAMRTFKLLWRISFEPKILENGSSVDF
jgi:hypothetical protein